MNTINRKKLQQLITRASGKDFVIETSQSVGGGCINEAWHVRGAGQGYFVKLNCSSGLDMFQAEFEGLQEIYQTGSIRVPRPLVCGQLGDQACLVMEYIALQGTGDVVKLGQQLAHMHRQTTEQFGWKRDNTIGSTPQINAEKDDWIIFLREQRLGYQLQLAASKGIAQHVRVSGERLLDRLDVFFQSYHPQPSLLHGDLWSGNAGYDDSGQPVIFDPAVYFGDREADIAMTELFGGFGAGFRDAYEDVWALDPGYVIRKKLYNLYHILNHFNLFGGSYGLQAGQMTDQLLAEI